VTEQEQHAEAHRLRAEDGYGARRIAAELGITRHAATQLLARPLPQPVAEPVAEVAELVAEPVAEVADKRPPVAEVHAPAEPLAVEERPLVAAAVGWEQPLSRPVADPPAEGVVWVAAPVGHVAGTVRFPLPGGRSPWLQVDLSRRRGLLRDLVALTRVGLKIPHVVEDVLRAFAAAYHQALATGHLQPGQGYEIHTRVRPCRHT
jgi:hypothetical protein